MDKAAVIALRKQLGIKAVRVPSGGMSESGHQIALMTWARLAVNTRPELRWLHSTLNGAPLSKSVAARLKAEGLVAGVPDMFLDVPRGCYHGLRLELKVPRIQGSRGEYTTTQAGKLSEEQDAWLTHYHEQGYCARVAYGWTHAKQLIEDYLDDKLEADHEVA